MSKRQDWSKVLQSDGHKENMRLFAAAIIYTKKVLNDPKLREYYRKKK
jgi:hypothetical protein